MKVHMPMSAGAITTFTGVLVQRRHKPGQKYIQLVFDTADGIRLSLSRNVAMVKGMVVGQTYHVKGQEHFVGSKSFIHEPVTVLAKPATSAAKSVNRSRKKLIIISSVVVGILLVGGAITLAANLLSGDKSRVAGSASTFGQSQVIQSNGGDVLGASSSETDAEDTAALDSVTSPSASPPAPTPQPSAAPRVVAPTPAPAPSPPSAPVVAQENQAQDTTPINPDQDPQEPAGGSADPGAGSNQEVLNQQPGSGDTTGSEETPVP